LLGIAFEELVENINRSVAIVIDYYTKNGGNRAVDVCRKKSPKAAEEKDSPKGTEERAGRKKEKPMDVLQMSGGNGPRAFHFNCPVSTNDIEEMMKGNFNISNLRPAA
jgi:hypothetical protein